MTKEQNMKKNKERKKIKTECEYHKVLQIPGRYQYDMKLEDLRIYQYQLCHV